MQTSERAASQQYHSPVSGGISPVQGGPSPARIRWRVGLPAVHCQAAGSVGGYHLLRPGYAAPTGTGTRVVSFLWAASYALGVMGILFTVFTKGVQGAHFATFTTMDFILYTVGKRER